MRRLQGELIAQLIRHCVDYRVLIISRLEQIRALEKQAELVTGKARELLFKQIDLQRAIIDRLLRRPVKEDFII